MIVCFSKYISNSNHFMNKFKQVFNQEEVMGLLFRIEGYR
jgi:hypothetical protein